MPVYAGAYRTFKVKKSFWLKCKSKLNFDMQEIGNSELKLPWDIDKKEEKVTGPEKQDEGILFTV